MVDKSIHICHSICQAVEFIHARQDSFGCQRFPLAHRDIKVFHRTHDQMRARGYLNRPTNSSYIFQTTILVLQYPGIRQRNGCRFS